MRREDRERLIRAACAVTTQHEVVVIGSQSILGVLDTGNSKSIGCAVDAVLNLSSACFPKKKRPDNMGRRL
jgi:hypothetical protein